MENSAKFLYMVGGILIALMVMSIGVYIFSTGALMTAQYDQKLSDEELKAYNAEFERYVTNEYVWLATDIVTVINKVYDINKKETEEGGNNFITIQVYHSPSAKRPDYEINNNTENGEIDLYQFIRDNTNQEKTNEEGNKEYYSNKFSCSITSYYPSGKVEKMKFVRESK